MTDDLSSWHSYPSIYALGHKACADLLKSPVLIQEKIDGSQFSCGRFDSELRCRSKGATLNLLAPEKMFIPAVKVAQELDLHPGWTYRGEFLVRPKHNALAYDRIPAKHIILFDINDGYESYLPYDAVVEEAQRLGLEVVPRLFEGLLTDVGLLRAMLDTTSCLGGQKIEGVVVKNYALFGPDKKVLMGKYVSEAFKEVHAAEWKTGNPNSQDVIAKLIESYRTPARWAKARQHLRESGALEGSPRDIPALMKEAQEDLQRECAEEIKAQLWSWAWPKICRGMISGLPEWLKRQLLEEQFEGEQSQP